MVARLCNTPVFPASGHSASLTTPYSIISSHNWFHSSSQFSIIWKLQDFHVWSIANFLSFTWTPFCLMNNSITWTCFTMGIIAESDSHALVDPAVFQNLQAKIDEDSSVREELKNILQTLERQGMGNKSSPYLISVFWLVLYRKSDAIYLVACAFNTCCSAQVSRRLSNNSRINADLSVQFKTRLRTLGNQLCCNLKLSRSLKR